MTTLAENKRPAPIINFKTIQADNRLTNAEEENEKTSGLDFLRTKVYKNHSVNINRSAIK